jgi:hypothetical protein
MVVVGAMIGSGIFLVFRRSTFSRQQRFSASWQSIAPRRRGPGFVIVMFGVPLFMLARRAQAPADISNVEEVTSRSTT